MPKDITEIIGAIAFFVVGLYLVLEIIKFLNFSSTSVVSGAVLFFILLLLVKVFAHEK